MWVRQNERVARDGNTRRVGGSSLFLRAPLSFLRPYDFQAAATQVKCTRKRYLKKKNARWNVENVLYRGLNNCNMGGLSLFHVTQLLIIPSSVKVCLTRFPCVSVEERWAPEDTDSPNCSEAASIALASWRCSPCVSFSFCCCFLGSLQEAFSRGRSPWSFLSCSRLSTT